MKKIFTLLFLLCSTNLFSQTIYYVKTSGNDANNGTSWATAFKTLQKAINTIDSGQIWVMAGTYYPDEGPGQTDNNRNSYFTLKAKVEIYGGFTGTETELNQRSLKSNITILSGDLQKNDGANFVNNGDNAYSVLRSNSTTGALLDGFTITGGNGTDGGGLLNSGPQLTIINCRFLNNASSEAGGAISNIRGNIAVINCSFIGNRSQYGGAVYSSGDYDEANTWPASAVFTNCSFSLNSATSFGGALYSSIVSSVSMTNCILWGNSGVPQFGNYQVSYDIAYRPQISYCIVQGGYGGNLNVDPLFVNGAAGDLHLQCSSPAINAGNSAVVTTPTDLDGQPRIGNTRVDMGAYELPSVLYVKANSTGLGNGNSWANAFTRLQDALAKAPLCNLPTQIWVAAGTYYPDETSSNNSNDRSASFVLKNNVALYGGFHGTEIELDQRNPDLNVTVLSGDITRSGIASSSYHVVRSTSVNSTAVLDGFIITSGNADGAGNNQGGGMFNVSGSPTITNCHFEINKAVEGAAIYNSSASPTLNYCQFFSNRANYGGGIYNYNNAPTFNGCSFRMNVAARDGGGVYNNSSSSTLINCLFWKNMAAAGAGVNNFFSSNVTITNCTFAANTANNGGAIYNWMAAPTLINSILWGNTTNQIAGDNATVTYSLVEGGYSGTGNLNEYPAFIDTANGNLHLFRFSPAVDTGNNAAVPASVTTDLDGASRFNGRVDMGAYEWHPTSTGGGGGPRPYTPLTITCPGDFTVNADSGRCGATLDYFDSHPALVMGGKEPVTVTYTPASPSFLSIGANTITVTATDSTGDTKTCSFIVTVVDTVPPVITDVTVTPSVLYPPNHKMQEVLVQYQASDCTPVTTTLSVTSNERQYGTGSGDTGPDWQVIDAHHVRLRAERSGNGTGRIYTITITTTDSAGNTAIATTTVSVPHDNGIGVTTNQRRIEKEELINGLKVQTIPNPTTDGFTIITQSSSRQLLNIQVTDNLGRIVERRTGVLPSGTIFLGNHYRPGMYFLEIIQGDTVQTLKLLKQSR